MSNLPLIYCVSKSDRGLWRTEVCLIVTGHLLKLRHLPTARRKDGPSASSVSLFRNRFVG